MQNRILLALLLLAPVAALASEAQALAGSTVTITVTADGTRPLTYQWLKDGVEIPGMTEDRLVLTGLVAAQAGNYTCRVGNLAGNVISDIASVTVVIKPGTAITTITTVNP